MSQRKASIALDTIPIDKQERVAIKSLFKGEATPDQQLLALSVIIKKLSRAFDLTYVPGSFDESSFLAGRGFVGQQLTRISNQPVDEKP